MDEFAPPIAKIESPSNAEGWKARVVVHCLILLLIVGLLVGVAPKFESIFTDFGIALPVMTSATLALSHVLARNLALVVLGFGLFAAADSHIQLHCANDPRQVRFARAWNNLAGILSIATVTFLVVVLFLPLVKLIEKLSG